LLSLKGDDKRAANTYDEGLERFPDALELRMKTTEVATRYKDRPEGSTSKLNTIRDGIRILRMIGMLVKEERPLAFFGYAALLLSVLSVGLSVPIVIEYMQTGLVPRLPTAVLSVGIMLVAVLSMACGLILDTVTHSRREIKRLAYLEGRAPQWPASAGRAAGGVEISAVRGSYPSRAENDTGSASVPGLPAAAS
jgi:hypothetical protein